MSRLEQFAPPIALIIIILSMTLGLCAQEMPRWVLPGMLMVETSSYYGDNGIIYRNQKRGKAGELGAFQALPATLRQFKFSPSLFEQDTKYAEAATVMILSHYYRVTGSWSEAIGAWNCGLGKRKSKTAINYLNRVKNAGETK